MTKTHAYAILWLLAALLSLFNPRLSSLAQTIPPSLNTVHLPVIMNPPTPTSTPTATPSPTATLTPLPTATATPLPTVTPEPTATTPALYICNRNAYNCSNFSTQAQAQAVFDYCMERVGFDVHLLDSDNDGEACESLPRRLW